MQRYWDWILDAIGRDDYVASLGGRSRMLPKKYTIIILFEFKNKSRAIKEILKTRSLVVNGITSVNKVGSSPANFLRNKSEWEFRSLSLFDAPELNTLIKGTPAFNVMDSVQRSMLFLRFIPLYSYVPAIPFLCVYTANYVP